MSALAFKRHFDASRRRFGCHGFGLEHDVVKTRRIHFLPNLDQVSIRPLHQAIHHFDDVKARAEGAVNRAHFQANDAAAQDEHALRHFFEIESTG